MFGLADGILFYIIESVFFLTFVVANTIFIFRSQDIKLKEMVPEEFLVQERLLAHPTNKL